MRFRLSITTLDDVLGLENAGDIFVCIFLLSTFGNPNIPRLRITLTAAPVVAVVPDADTQRVPYRRTAYP